VRRTLPDDESLLLASYLTVLHVWCRHAGNHMTCRCGNEFCFMCKVGDWGSNYHIAPPFAALTLAMMYGAASVESARGEHRRLLPMQVLPAGAAVNAGL